MMRLHQATLILAFVGFSWLAMQAVHEFGHVLAAEASGGQVSKVVLHPGTISRTEFKSNPHPLFVCWAGPIMGSFVPLLIFLLARLLRFPGPYLFRFLAAFCLIANGGYIGLGAFQRLGDAGDLLRYGAAMWQLIFFAILTVPLGFYLLNGLGVHFGLGKSNGKVSRTCAVVSVILLLLTAGIEILLSGR